MDFARVKAEMLEVMGGAAGAVRAASTGSTGLHGRRAGWH